jgi:hypothetical protein
VLTLMSKPCGRFIAPLASATVGKLTVKDAHSPATSFLTMRRDASTPRLWSLWAKRGIVPALGDHRLNG